MTSWASVLLLLWDPSARMSVETPIEEDILLNLIEASHYKTPSPNKPGDKSTQDPILLTMT